MRQNVRKLEASLNIRIRKVPCCLGMGEGVLGNFVNHSERGLVTEHSS